LFLALGESVVVINAFAGLKRAELTAVRSAPMLAPSDCSFFS